MDFDHFGELAGSILIISDLTDSNWNDTHTMNGAVLTYLPASIVF